MEDREQIEKLNYRLSDYADKPDCAVIEKINEGENDLFEILVRRNNQLLFRVLRSYFRYEKDVEDAMQEAYVKAFQNLHKFRGEAKFSTWLIRIGINEALQKKRLRATKKVFSIDNEEHINQIESTPTMNPENQVIYSQSKAFIEEAIDQLPEKYKIVFMLKEVEQLSVAEIAEALDLSESNVKVRVHRAREQMKDYVLKKTHTASVFEFGNSKCDRVTEKVMAKIRKF